MDKYELTVEFESSMKLKETYKTPLGAHRAVQWWMSVADTLPFKILNFDIKEI